MALDDFEAEFDHAAAQENAARRKANKAAIGKGLPGNGKSKAAGKAKAKKSNKYGDSDSEEDDGMSEDDFDDCSDSDFEDAKVIYITIYVVNKVIKKLIDVNNI